MSMRGAVAGCVVLMCLVALQLERTEGHITFFSPKEMMLMKEREGRKDMEPRSEGSHLEEVPAQHLPEAEHAGSPDKTVELALRLTPKQLDQVAPVIFQGIVEDRQKAK